MEPTKTGARSVLVLSMLLASLGTSIANIALPALSRAMAAPFGQVQWVTIAYLAGLTVFALLAGRIGDRWGLRQMHLAGLALFALAALGCGLAPNLPMLVAARAVQGIAAAFLMTLAVALMRQMADQGRLGRAMGAMGTASALGTALGPSLGGLLLEAAGWRGIFLMQVPLAVLALGLAMAVLPPDRAQAPGAQGGLLPERALLRGLLANLLIAAVMMTTLVVGPFYLGGALGLDAMQIGLVMSVGPMMSILGGVPAGRAVDAWGAGPVLACGLVLLAGGAFLLAWGAGWLGVAGYALGLAVLAPGYQMFQAAINVALLADTSPARRGTVSGLLSLSRNIGLILGTVVMGAVFARAAGLSDMAQATPQAMTQGLRLTFMLSGGAMLGALWMLRRGAVAAAP